MELDDSSGVIAVLFKSPDEVSTDYARYVAAIGIGLSLDDCLSAIDSVIEASLQLMVADSSLYISGFAIFWLKYGNSWADSPPKDFRF
jgi:hypothetical protein